MTLIGLQPNLMHETSHYLCYGLYRAVKDVKMFIIGVLNLVIEVDAKYIKGMINNLDVIPSAAANRWIAYLLLFTFSL